MTPLHYAANYGHREIVKNLLIAGVNINVEDEDKWTPLHRAAANGHKEIIEILLKAGAYVNAVQKNKRTPLHCAAAHGYKEIVEILLKAGANVNDKDVDNWTPLHWAANYGHTEAVEILLKAGANNNAEDDDNLTPLHGAAANGHKEIVEILLTAGANVNDKDVDNWTPLHWTANYGHTEAVEILLKAGANVNAEDKYKLSPLHLAARRGHKNIEEILVRVRVCSKLVRAGANINAKCQLGHTPLYYSNENGHRDVSRFLLQSGGKTEQVNLQSFLWKVSGKVFSALASHSFTHGQKMKTVLRARNSPDVISTHSEHIDTRALPEECMVSHDKDTRSQTITYDRQQCDNSVKCIIHFTSDNITSSSTLTCDCDQPVSSDLPSDPSLLKTEDVKRQFIDYLAKFPLQYKRQEEVASTDVTSELQDRITIMINSPITIQLNTKVVNKIGHTDLVNSGGSVHFFHNKKSTQSDIDTEEDPCIDEAV